MRGSHSVLVSTLLVSLAAGSSACNKGGTATVAPGGDGTSGGSAPSAAGELLRYGSGRSVRQATQYTIKVSGGGQVGEAVTTHKATLSLAPEGEGLKVGWKIDAVDGVALKGMFEPKDEATKSFDLAAYAVQHGTGVYLTDLRGELDEEATQALPENAEKAKAAEARNAERQEAMEKAKADEKDPPAFPEAAGEQLISMLEGSFNLPTLPEQALEVGKSVTEEEEDEKTIQGSIKIPVESETTYTLVKIDEVGGQRIAELTVEVESSGATELPQGMLVLDQATDGTMRFDLDAQVPVSVKVNTTQSVSMGDFLFETNVVVDSTYEAV